MKSDPAAYIYFTAVLCFCLGFVACAIICARRIRQAEMEGWKRGVCCRERETRL